MCELKAFKNRRAGTFWAILTLFVMFSALNLLQTLDDQVRPPTASASAPTRNYQLWIRFWKIEALIVGIGLTIAFLILPEMDN